MARADARRMPNRAFEILACGPKRVLDGMAEREVRRNRGGERAAGPVRVPPRKARTAEFELPGAVDGIAEYQVDGFGAVEVPTLYDYDARAEPEDSLPGGAHVVQ